MPTVVLLSDEVVVGLIWCVLGQANQVSRLPLLHEPLKSLLQEGRIGIPGAVQSAIGLASFKQTGHCEVEWLQCKRSYNNLVHSGSPSIRWILFWMITWYLRNYRMTTCHQMNAVLDDHLIFEELQDDHLLSDEFCSGWSLDIWWITDCLTQKHWDSAHLNLPKYLIWNIKLPK